MPGSSRWSRSTPPTTLRRPNAPSACAGAAGVDNTPRRLVTLIPERVDSQRRHDRLVRRHGWRTSYNAISRSFVFTIDLHYYGGAFTRGNPHDPRIHRLFPTGRQFITTHYIPAFYPEIVRLAELFCTARCRAAAEQTLPWFRRPLDSPEPTNATSRDPHQLLLDAH